MEGIKIIRKILSENFLSFKEKEFLRLRLEGNDLLKIKNELNLSDKELSFLQAQIKEKLKNNLTLEELKEYISFFKGLFSPEENFSPSRNVVCDDLGKEFPLWISYSSLSDYQKCHLLYYYRNVYRSPLTDRKIEIARTFTSLGNAVHKVTEEIAKLDPKERLKVSLRELLTKIWDKEYKGERGGFKTEAEEKRSFQEALEMLEIFRSSYIFQKQALLPDFLRVRILEDSKDEVYLVGKIDWAEVLEDKSLHIVDFKTGRSLEDEDSLQLPIYYILSAYNLEYPVRKISYFYLRRDEKPREFEVSSISDYLPQIYKLAEEIKELREVGVYRCTAKNHSKCECNLYRDIIEGKGKWVGVREETKKDIYIV